jgi:hypothetical protein
VADVVEIMHQAMRLPRERDPDITPVGDFVMQGLTPSFVDYDCVFIKIIYSSPHQLHVEPFYQAYLAVFNDKFIIFTGALNASRAASLRLRHNIK